MNFVFSLMIICFVSLSSLAARTVTTPIFSKKQISVDNSKLTVEIADTPEKSAHGLMFRKTMSQDHGMLFIFPDEEPRSFWMKNTFLPLSIGYFSKEKVLIDIQDMEPVKSEMEQPKVYPSAGPAKYALEVNQGWFKKNKIKLGAKLKY